MCPHMINYVVFRHTNSKKCKVENLFCKGTNLTTDLGSQIRNFNFRYFTVWKFSNFTAALILREINFG